MSGPDDARLDLLRDVLPGLELVGVQVMELAGSRRDFVSDDDDGRQSEELLEVDGTQMAVNVLQSEEWLIVRIAGGATTDQVHVRVTIDGRFSKSDPAQLGDEALSVFVERVAIMSMYPFVRQAVHDMSSRLGAPATLHLLRAGQILVTDTELTDEATDPV